MLLSHKLRKTVCIASLPFNTTTGIPTNKRHVQNLARCFKFCTNRLMEVDMDYRSQSET